jgi:sugar lactone lactonase YvrE
VLITPGGAVGQAADEIAFSDGMAATPDNSTLIIAESFGGRPTAYDIVTDGRVSNQRGGPRC